MSQERVMLLIDADNLSIDVMEQAVRLLLNQHGGLHVRRAYCTAESAVANQAAFKRMGIKPMVNLAAGKNSTDIAMAVDAIDLVLAERPDVVVIASSDSDFAPLVQRLREKGCVVRGVGQKGKVGDETQDVYDDYTVIEHRGGAAPRTAAAKTTRAPRPSRARAPAKRDGATPVQAGKPAAEPAAQTAAKSPPARKSAGRRSAKVVAAEEAVQSLPVAQVLAATASPDPLPIAPTLDDGVPAAAKPASRARKGRSGKAAVAAVALEVANGTGHLPEMLEATQAPDADAAAAPAPARRRGRKATADSSADMPAGARAPTPSPAASREHKARSAAVKRTADEPGAETPAGNAPRATLQAVLACLPELARGQSMALNVAVQRLREARLLGKNSSSLKLFSQLSDSMELLPARNPSQVRLRA